jgi:hypothetical protein
MKLRRFTSQINTWTIAISAAALLLAGCGGGPTLGRVEGTVTLDGQPLADAKVEFQPTSGSPSYATTDAQGDYKLMFAPDQYGAIPGDHVVRITTFQASSEPGSTDVVEERVPAKYNSESELHKNVTTGRQEIDFPLSSS